MDASGLPARILDAIPRGVLLLDERGAIRYANRRAREITGYPKGELRGRDAALLVPRPEREEARSRLAPDADPDASSIEERRLLGRDGRTVPVLLDRRPIDGGDGSSYLLCTFRRDGSSSDGADLGRGAEPGPSPWCGTVALFRDRARRALALARRRRLRVGVLVVREASASAVSGLRRALRETDAAVELEDGELVVMLGELESREAGRRAVERLERRLGTSGAGNWTIGVAVAPRDGVHVGELVEAARRDLEAGSAS